LVIATLGWKPSLAVLTQRSWVDLMLSWKHGSGCEKIGKMKIAIPKSVTDEVTLLAFRFHGKCPMVGSFT
jgi:hypothetical protein